MENDVERNIKLIEEFPFLAVRNWRDGSPILGYYESTYLDDMPKGWAESFGLDMCKEIKDELVKTNSLDSYVVWQVKEKFGELRWYDDGANEKIEREIIPKYEEISARTCVNCGKPAVYLTSGWICPYCQECGDELIKHGEKVTKIHSDGEHGV